MKAKQVDKYCHNMKYIYSHLDVSWYESWTKVPPEQKFPHIFIEGADKSSQPIYNPGQKFHQNVF